MACFKDLCGGVRSSLLSDGMENSRVGYLVPSQALHQIVNIFLELLKRVAGDDVAWFWLEDGN